MRHARLVILLVAAFGSIVGAQTTDPAPSPPARPESAAVDPRLATLDAARARLLDAQGRPVDEGALQRIDDALVRLRAIPALREQAQANGAEAAGAPGLVASLQAELDAPAPPPESLIPESGADVATLEAAQRSIDERLRAVRARLDAGGRLRVEHAGRLDAIPGELAAASARLEHAEDRLSSAGTESGPSEGESVQRLLLEIDRDHARATLNALDAERRFIQDTAARNELRARLAEREAQGLARARELLAHRVADARHRDATRQQAETRLAAANVPPELEPLRKAALALGAEQTRLVVRLNAVESDLAATRSLAQQVAERDAQIRSRVAGTTGGTQIGQLLQRAKETLPDPKALRAEATRLTHEAAALDDRAYELEMLLESLPADDRALRDLLRDDLSIPAPTDEQIETARALVDLRAHAARELRQTLVGPSRLIAQEQELAAAKSDLALRVASLAEFVNARILWIRSDPSLARVSARSALQGLDPLLDASLWKALRDEAQRRRPFVGVFAVAAPAAAALLVGIWIVSTRRMRSLNERVQMPSSDRLWLTLAAAALGAVKAGVLPLALFAFSRLAESLAGDRRRLVDWLAEGLERASLSVFIGSYLLVLCRPGGVGQAHFRWHKAACASVCRLLRWYTPTIAVMVFLIDGARASGGVEATALVRWLAPSALLLTAAFFGLLLRPRGPLMSGVVEHSLWRGWRVVWPILTLSIIGAFASLAVLHALGWTFSVGVLARRLLDTAAVAAALVLLRAVLLRWLAIARRRLAFEQHRKTLEKLAAEQAEAASRPGATARTGDEDALVAPPPPPPEIDLGSIQRQTRQLVNLGVSALGVLIVIPIWREVFPAIERMDAVRLFPFSVPDGATAEQMREAGRYVLSLADLLGALLIGFIGSVAIRSLPRLFDGFVLSRTHLDAGARYAMTTLSRYLLIAIVALMLLASLGFSGKSLGWAIAGLSVGLGLGLQEFVSNLVAGLSLLFERTVRPGDWVKVGDVEGIVRSISIRATVLTDFDRRDVVIPNRNLISEIVVNYTRSDSTGRAIIKVGVAYGSDSRFVEHLLAETVKAHPLVDEALVTFDTFGDNALNFTLRLYVSDISQRLAIVNEVHHRIAAAFARHGVEISFPQRDLHVRGGALEVRLINASAPAARVAGD